MKSTRFYIKSLIVATLMVVSSMQAGYKAPAVESADLATAVTDAVASFMDRFMKQNPEQISQAIAAEAVGTAAQKIIEDGAKIEPVKISAMLATAVSDAFNRVSLAEKALKAGEKLTPEQVLAAAAGGSGEWSPMQLGGLGLLLAGLTYGGHKLYRYFNPTEARQAFDEISKGALEELQSIEVLENFLEMYKDAFKQLSAEEQRILDLMIEKRRSELATKRSAEEAEAKVIAGIREEKALIESLQAANESLRVENARLKESLQKIETRLKSQIEQLENQVSTLRGHIDEKRVIVAPVAPSSVSVQQPAAVVQPLTEGELEQIYRRRTTSQAGIQGILKDEGLMARLKASSGKTAQEILKKITK